MTSFNAGRKRFEALEMIKDFTPEEIGEAVYRKKGKHAGFKGAGEVKKAYEKVSGKKASISEIKKSLQNSVEIVCLPEEKLDVIKENKRTGVKKWKPKSIETPRKRTNTP